MKPRLILAFPRSATKLLSSIHEAVGYHAYGEFFNTYSTDIEHGTARRASIESQRQRRNLITEMGVNEFNYMHGLKINQRYTHYKDLLKENQSPSVVTAWYATFGLLPESSELLCTHEILCLKRNNTFDQLISRLVTIKNLNHDQEIETKPITVDKPAMEYYYYYMRKTNNLQNYCVKNGLGFWVDFDELINGTADVGFEYRVNTTDQHDDLSQYVTNYEQAHDFFIEIKTRYDRYDDIEFKEER
jgi:hypothetical protein